ncbi:MAG: ribosome biogenesis GTP-binding protein YihA/YsxC [Candidatus Gracilibacteria bacterium]|nr:ribosome biogenesis GTP-binding protein YihA/YsxC [Candidatus Gracilibacteria bacterium]
MKIIDAVFVKSVFIDDSKVLFDNKKEIIFVGRSNVGKSSLMNTLMGKKDLVKTSSKPGKTKTANLFLVNNKYYFTDLPGYGFAKLGKEVKEKLDALISWYVEERGQYIKRVYMLIDSKIGPQQTDIDMYKYLLELGAPVSIVLSKVDRLSKNEITKSLNHSESEFFGQKIFPVSSAKNIGIKELFADIREALGVK